MVKVRNVIVGTWIVLVDEEDQAFGKDPAQLVNPKMAWPPIKFLPQVCFKFPLV